MRNLLSHDLILTIGHLRRTSNLEQVANLLYAQANSASYPPWDGK